MNLTPRQTEILDLIRSYISDTGFPPTRSDICEAFGFRSPNAAEEHLRALARRGAIELLPGTSRGIRVLAPAEPEGLPLIGAVTAGKPILADEHIEKYCNLDPALFRPRPHYLLRMPDMSMQDAGILEGDLLAVCRARQVQNDQVMAARLDDELVVTRFRRHGRWKHRVKLLPENPDYSAAEVDMRERSLVIEGRIVGVLRTRLG